MSEEEQWAFWNSERQDLSRRLSEIEARQQADISVLRSALFALINRTQAMHTDLLQAMSSSLPEPGFKVPASVSLPTSRLDVETLCWLHRVALSGSSLPEAIKGVIRTVNVWIGSPGNTPSHVPPEASEVAPLLDSWASHWRDDYRNMLSESRDTVILRLTQFYYEFLRIHPFLDGNGRLGRLLLDQASRELLNHALSPAVIADTQSHQEALLAANSGNLEPLKTLIVAALL